MEGEVGSFSTAGGGCSILISAGNTRQWQAALKEHSGAVVLGSSQYLDHKYLEQSTWLYLLPMGPELEGDFSSKRGREGTSLLEEGQER